MRYVNSAVANCDHAQNQATYCTCEVTEWQNKRNQKIPGTLSNPGNPLDFWYKGIMSPDRMSRDRMSPLLPRRQNFAAGRGLRPLLTQLATPILTSKRPEVNKSGPEL
jgi:hypothetical protein